MVQRWTRGLCNLYSGSTSAPRDKTYGFNQKTNKKKPATEFLVLTKRELIQISIDKKKFHVLREKSDKEWQISPQQIYVICWPILLQFFLNEKNDELI